MGAVLACLGDLPQAQQADPEHVQAPGFHGPIAERAEDLEGLADLGAGDHDGARLELIADPLGEMYGEHVL